MKNIILLVLFLYCLTLVSIESDPSEVVGYVKYQCQENANGNYTPIAISMNSGYTRASELDADYPEITSIGVWNSETQQWDIGVDYGAGHWFPDPEFSENQPILVTVSETIDIYIAGTMNSDPSYFLITNENGNSTPIMLPLDSEITSPTMLGENTPEVNSISFWNPTTQLWEISVNNGENEWSTNPIMEAGNVYFFSVDSDITWPDNDRFLPSDNNFDLDKKIIK